MTGYAILTLTFSVKKWRLKQGGFELKIKDGPSFYQRKVPAGLATQRCAEHCGTTETGVDHDFSSFSRFQKKCLFLFFAIDIS